MTSLFLRRGHVDGEDAYAAMVQAVLPQATGAFARLFAANAVAK
jgi:hypothetical protein